MIQKLFNILVRNLLPFTCIICHGRAESNLDLCAPCQQELPWLTTACQRCARQLKQQELTICPSCQCDPPAYQRLLALFDYQIPITQIISRLKFSNQLLYARVLGELMAKHLPQPNAALPDLLLPVPLHPQRLRERGYNQALELTKIISKRLDIPFDSTHCQRIKYTSPQAQAHGQVRHHNLSGAFQIKNLSVQSIAIVDDVVTTGHTVNELAKALNAQGITRIEVWCCARTQWQRN